MEYLDVFKVCIIGGVGLGFVSFIIGTFTGGLLSIFRKL